MEDEKWIPGDPWQYGAQLRKYDAKKFEEYLNGNMDTDTSTRDLIVDTDRDNNS